jgi:hypothetical protein
LLGKVELMAAMAIKPKKAVAACLSLYISFSFRMAVVLNVLKPYRGKKGKKLSTAHRCPEIGVKVGFEVYNQNRKSQPNNRTRKFTPADKSSNDDRPAT